MASIYPRKKSPFWWVQFKNLQGETVDKSTKLRRDHAQQSRQAYKVRDDLTRRELEAAGRTDENWNSWVPAFLHQRYRKSPETLKRYLTTWGNLTAYFRLHQVTAPQQLSRVQVRKFVEWRQKGDQGNGGGGMAGAGKCALNTALYDIKVLRIVMNEAVACGFCPTNPCAKLGLKRDEPEEKPEITFEQHGLILRSLKTEAAWLRSMGQDPEWMRVAYRIAWYQGTRLRENSLPLSQVNLETNQITFLTKGRRLFATALVPALRPMFRRLLREGRAVSCVIPPMASKTWWRFFKRIGLAKQGVCFHCTRVSAASRCYRNKMTEPEAMRFIGHSSTTVHKVYRRLHVQRDLQPHMAGLARSAGLTPRQCDVDIRQKRAS